MAQYEAQCSKVGSFAYSQYFKLYVVLTDGEVSGNYSKVNYNVFCQSSGSGSIEAQHWKYFNLNGQEIVSVTEKINVSSPNAYIHIVSGASDWIEHNSDGSKSIWFSAQIKANSYGVVASLESTFELVKIPRYTTVWQSERGKTINTISINWTTADARDWTQYSLNGGAWQDAYDTVDSSNKNGYYTISGLSPNTSYTVKTRCRRADSGLWSETEALTITTYDIAKISNIPDFKHGNDGIVSIINPGNISNLSLVMKIENEQILSRTVSAGDNTITFNDKELDNLYKKYGSSNILTASFVLTGSGYTNSKTCTITFKGNQKTIRTNVSDEWKRGKLWTYVNDTWKRGVSWQNVNGTWKRGI